MKHAALLGLASLLLVPAVGAAQTVPAPWLSISPPPGSSVTVSVRATPTPAPAPVPTPAPMVLSPNDLPPPMVSDAPVRPSRGTRLFLQGLAGLGLGMGGALVGGLAGFALGSGTRNDTVCPADAVCTGGASMGLGGMMLGVGVGWFGGVPLGVTLAGHARGGNGGYGWALLGTLGGTLAGTFVGYGLDEAGGGRDRGATGVVGLLGGVVGAVMGYELSNTADDPRPAPRREAAVRLTPSASVSPQGALLGVGGVF